MYTPDIVYTKLTSAEVSELGEEYMMLYDSTHDYTHILNPMMFFIWEKCDGKNSVSDILLLVKSEFDTTGINPIQIQDDCISALEMLEKNKLVVALDLGNNRDAKKST